MDTTRVPSKVLAPKTRGWKPFELIGKKFSNIDSPFERHASRSIPLSV